MSLVSATLLALAATASISSTGAELPSFEAVAFSTAAITLEDAFPHVTEGTHEVLFARIDVAFDEPLRVCPVATPEDESVAPDELSQRCLAGHPEPLDLLSISAAIDAVSQAVLADGTFLRCDGAASVDDFLPFAVEMCERSAGTPVLTSCVARELRGDASAGDASQLLPVRDLLKRTGRAVGVSSSSRAEIAKGSSMSQALARPPDFSLLFALVGDDGGSGGRSWPAGCSLHIQDSAAGPADRLLWRYDADEPLRAVLHLQRVASPTSAAAHKDADHASASAAGDSPFAPSASHIVVVPGLRQPLAPSFASRLQQTHLYPHLPSDTTQHGHDDAANAANGSGTSGAGSSRSSEGSINAFLEFDGGLAVRPHAAEAAAASDRLRRRHSTSGSAASGDTDADSVAVLIEAHAGVASGSASTLSAAAAQTHSGLAAASLARRRVRRRRDSSGAATAAADTATADTATASLAADAFLEAGMARRHRQRTAFGNAAGRAMGTAAAELDDSHVPALIDAQLAALAVFRHDYAEDDAAAPASAFSSAVPAARHNGGSQGSVLLETASAQQTGQLPPRGQPQPFADALQQLEALGSSDAAADALANIGLEGAGSPRLAVLSSSPFEHDHDEYHVDEDDGALHGSAALPAITSGKLPPSGAAASAQSDASSAAAPHVFPTALQRHIARLQPALMHGFAGAAAVATDEMVALELQGRAGSGVDAAAAAGAKAQARAIARAAAAAASRASAAMSAYLAARVTGLKSIMDPIVGSVMNPTSKQITSPIAGQMTDAVGNGAGQELKGETVSDVAALLTRALTYNLTSLLTDLVTTKTAGPLSTALTGDIMPPVARAAIDGAVARIHDALTAHGLSAEHRRDDGDAYAAGRRTGRPGVPPAAGGKEDDGDQTAEGSPIMGVRLGATKSGAQWVAGDHDGRAAPLPRDPKGKPLPRPESDASAGAEGAFDNGNGALLEPRREPVLVELISNTVRCRCRCLPIVLLLHRCPPTASTPSTRLHRRPPCLALALTLSAALAAPGHVHLSLPHSHPRPVAHPPAVAVADADARERAGRAARPGAALPVLLGAARRTCQPDRCPSAARRRCSGRQPRPCRCGCRRYCELAG